MSQCHEQRTVRFRHNSQKYESFKANFSLFPTTVREGRTQESRREDGRAGNETGGQGWGEDGRRNLAPEIKFGTF